MQAVRNHHKLTPWLVEVDSSLVGAKEGAAAMNREEAEELALGIINTGNQVAGRTRSNLTGGEV